MRLRWILTAPLLGLCACATDAASRSDTVPEVVELRSALKASRERSDRLERKLEMLEAQRAVGDGVGAASSRSARPESSLEMPTLTVVKLKPRVEPAPRLDTRLRIVEPSAERVEAIEAAVTSTDRDPTPVEDPALVDFEYEKNVQAIRTGNVEGGADKLDTFADAHPKHPSADNALYFAGLARMGLEDFEGAAQRFERVEREYPAGDAVADAMMKLAECRMRLNRPADAKALYVQVARSFPGTLAANQAQARLTSLRP